MGGDLGNGVGRQTGLFQEIARLVPLVERNYNLIELGPRGTGKSFIYQQISPYSHLISGGQTTVAQMLVNLANGQKGLVALWDTVAFDEAAGIRFVDKNGISIMKNYMEDGAFSRGKDIINAGPRAECHHFHSLDAVHRRQREPRKAAGSSSPCHRLRSSR